MPTYVALISETQTGSENIRDSVQRATRFREEAKGLGITVKAQYWTLGRYDGVLVLEALDDETAAAALFRLNAKGSVRAETLRAFDAEEMTKVLGRSGA
jgi:uncharacterized protein with GYD domain